MLRCGLGEVSCVGGLLLGVRGELWVVVIIPWLKRWCSIRRPCGNCRVQQDLDRKTIRRCNILRDDLGGWPSYNIEMLWQGPCTHLCPPPTTSPTRTTHPQESKLPDLSARIRNHRHFPSLRRYHRSSFVSPPSLAEGDSEVHLRSHLSSLWNSVADFPSYEGYQSLC